MLTCPNCEAETDQSTCPECGTKVSDPDDRLDQMIEEARYPTLGTMFRHGRKTGALGVQDAGSGPPT